VRPCHGDPQRGGRQAQGRRDAGGDRACDTGLRDLKVEGVAFTLVGGVDRGLRAGNASYALTCDLVDDEAYRIYDADPEHNRIRREMFAPLSVLVERVQFQLP